ncbi:hypothetical protein [Mycobacterium sp. 852002-40037_SCH5390672]|uniref:hypothetical protein n=1 Tax=Mycobacterium sp. 852002-40037_SCH5390672 TaxID=1834089 RepID=UPI00082B2123|nr:hypothetical protein [Mycobacterium sp. 852002-40037_SCH5390672]
MGVEVGDAISLICWDDVRAIAPDGHDPLNHPNDGDKGVVYPITDISPVPGTMVGRKDVITAHVVPEPLPAAQPAFFPCGWVTNDEAAGLLGGLPTTALPTGDEPGSATPFCSYHNDSHLVTSELQLPPDFPVDARTEQDMDAASGHMSELSGLPGRATCSESENEQHKKSTRLLVLLSGNRLYQAMGIEGASCDTLKQFAQAAIPRIGNIN